MASVLIRLHQVTGQTQGCCLYIYCCPVHNVYHVPLNLQVKASSVRYSSSYNSPSAHYTAPSSYPAELHRKTKLRNIISHTGNCQNKGNGNIKCLHRALGRHQPEQLQRTQGIDSTSEIPSFGVLLMERGHEERGHEGSSSTEARETAGLREEDGTPVPI